MTKRTKSSSHDDDAPLTAAELKTARRFKDCPPDFIRVVRASMLGRPVGRTKTPIHLSLDTDLVQTLRNTGKGWQTRANAALRKSFKLPPVVNRNSHA